MEAGIGKETLLRVVEEIRRQNALRDAGKFSKTCAQMSDTDAFLVVAEEIGEVADALLARDYEHARKEAIEVVACCVQWLDAPRGANFVYKTDFKNADRVLKLFSSAGDKARDIMEIFEAAQ
jgi:phosphoribosylaminoimidazole (AIR) synthetase